MMRNGTTRTWLTVGLLTALLLPGCATGGPAALPAAPAPAVAAQAKSVALASLAITDAMVTCSEIVHDLRPVGFHLSGHLPGGERVTLFYNGMEPVAPGTADVDVPDDAMIARLRALRGRYDLQVSSGSRLPSRRAFRDTDRQDLLAAVQRTLKASPVGRNPQGQTVRVVLAFVERTLRDPKSGQE